MSYQLWRSSLLSFHPLSFCELVHLWQLSPHSSPWSCPSQPEDNWGVRRTETYGSIICTLWSLLSVVCHHVFLTCSPGKRDWPTPWTETAACPDCCWGLPAPQWGKPPCSSGWTLSEPATVFWSHSSPLKSRPTGPAADSGPGSLKLCPLRSSPPPSLQQQYNVKREAHTCSFL